MKAFAKDFYNSKKWQACRSAYIADRIQADGGLCEVCHEYTGFIVHHKIMLDSVNIHKPEIALNPDNLMYVCRNCHDQFDGHFNKTKSFIKRSKPLTVSFDSNGDPSPRSDS